MIYPLLNIFIVAIYSYLYYLYIIVLNHFVIFLVFICYHSCCLLISPFSIIFVYPFSFIRVYFLLIFYLLNYQFLTDKLIISYPLSILCSSFFISSIFIIIVCWVEEETSYFNGFEIELSLLYHHLMLMCGILSVVMSISHYFLHFSI